MKLIVDLEQSLLHKHSPPFSIYPYSLSCIEHHHHAENIGTHPPLQSVLLQRWWSVSLPPPLFNFPFWFTQILHQSPFQPLGIDFLFLGELL
jgi:hypothetical protein